MVIKKKLMMWKYLNNKNEYLKFWIGLLKQMEIDYEFYNLGFRISCCL